MDDKLNIQTIIYDEVLDKPTIIDTVSELVKEGPPGKDGEDGSPGKDGPQGKSGKSVVDKATTATINQIKANQEIQIKYIKEFEHNFTLLFKKIDFIENKLAEFE